VHLWKAIVACDRQHRRLLFFKDVIIAIQTPINTAMHDVFVNPSTPSRNHSGTPLRIGRQEFSRSNPGEADIGRQTKPVDPNMVIEIDALEIARKLHASAPETFRSLRNASPATVAVIWKNPFGTF